VDLLKENKGFNDVFMKYKQKEVEVFMSGLLIEYLVYCHIYSSL